MHAIQEIREITDRYDVMLCDVWGVLHNGVQAYAQACDALVHWRKAGKSVVLITNSPRPHPGVIAQLRMLGVPDEAYDRVVTSGDVTRSLIAEGPSKIFLLGPQRDLALLDGLAVTRVAAEEAQAIVCTGFFDDETETPEDYRALFTDMVARGLPLICANPDLWVERGHRMIPCAGALAEFYAALGGTTRVAGKPHRPIYEASLSAAAEIHGAALDRARVIAVGDGMPTDVKGALDHGLDLLYVAAGVHQREYSLDVRPDGHSGRIDEEALTRFLAEHRANPTFWMTRLA